MTTALFYFYVHTLQCTFIVLVVVMTHIQMKEVGEVVLGEDEVEGLDDGPMNGEELILVWKK